MPPSKKESKQPSAMGRDEPLIGENFNQQKFIGKLNQVLKNRGVNLGQPLSGVTPSGGYGEDSLEARMLKDNPSLTPEKLERLLRSN